MPFPAVFLFTDKSTMKCVHRNDICCNCGKHIDAGSTTCPATRHIDDLVTMPYHLQIAQSLTGYQISRLRELGKWNPPVSYTEEVQSTAEYDATSLTKQIELLTQVQTCLWRTNKTKCKCDWKKYCTQYDKDVTVQDCMICIQTGKQNLDKFNE